jgi:hypothetical protein
VASEQRHLRDDVIAGVRAVDAVFRRLSDDVLRIVRQLSSPLSMFAKRRAMRLIDLVLDRTFGLVQRTALVSELFMVITRATETTALGVFGRAVNRVRDAVESARPGWWPRIVNTQPPTPFTRVVAAVDYWDEFGNRITPQSIINERLKRSLGFDPNRRWVDPDGYRLSDRIWKGGREVRREIDRILQDGIRNGTSAVDLADNLQRFLNPDAAPITYHKDGRIVRRNTTKTPYGKSGSSFARALARTEISRAHGMAVIESAKVTPGVRGVQWRLSGSHPEPDACDDNASRDRYGLGAGVYPPDKVPRYPNHPNDICALLPAVASRADVLDDLVKEYGA